MSKPKLESKSLESMFDALLAELAKQEVEAKAKKTDGKKALRICAGWHLHNAEPGTDYLISLAIRSLGDTWANVVSLAVKTDGKGFAVIPYLYYGEFLEGYDARLDVSLPVTGAEPIYSHILTTLGEEPADLLSDVNGNK